MEELIPISENNGKRAVNARDLHAFLESKQEFTHWISNRIRQYDLVEDEDYQILTSNEVFDKSIKNPKGGRPRVEFALSLDCAKELSMVEGNEKGKQARRYFIACEKKLKEVTKKQLQEPERKKVPVLDLAKSTLVELMPGVVVQAYPSRKYGFLMSVYDVSKALNRHYHAINSRRKNSSDCIEGEHYIIANNYCFDRDSEDSEMEAFVAESILKMGFTHVVWTRKGLLWLCDTIKGGQSNWVRDWAKNYSPVANAALAAIHQIQTMPKSEQVLGLLSNLFNEFKESIHEERKGGTLW